ncbi:MAG: glucose-6-phosphate dehydrogenase assembly protein OpcA [Actinomycetota bacterium]|nr:glucose-6-phosphate dehydrogenase assembly protein OpcA [Actinomycetota bacterium]
MNIDLTETNAGAVASALVRARRSAGSPAMGMVLTLVVVTDEAGRYDAMKTASSVSAEHPSRVLGVIRRAARGPARLDASIKIGNNVSGEAVLLRTSGELVHHAESIVLPLLLPDSPVVVWWPQHAPDDLAADPLGSLAQRRISDSASVGRGRRGALIAQATHYAPGNTDLAWTRLTPWRALLAAALDQHPVKITGAAVVAERANPSADLMAAWLQVCLGVDVERRASRGPGITDVRLQTRHGDIAVSRPSGRSATFTIPGEADRPVALKRREVDELLAEELRRLDEDDVFATMMRCVAAWSNGRGNGSATKRAKPVRTPDKKEKKKKASNKARS